MELVGILKYSYILTCITQNYYEIQTGKKIQHLNNHWIYPCKSTKEMLVEPDREPEPTTRLILIADPWTSCHNDHRQRNIVKVS